ncbi:MAG: M13 family metallopeptidase [Candidatus Aminicenantes bacterium]|nr:MAG: M13 family metallopeptidase [Candidatus Aminicenantes bacterium]
MALVLFTFTGYAQEKIPPLHRENMDFSVRPGDDFFRYANGAWLDRVKIPDDKTSYTAFDIVREYRDEAVRQLLESTAKITSAKEGSTAHKISDFFATGMDIKKVEAQGVTPLEKEFGRIAKISTITDIQDAIAYFHTHGIPILFSGSVFQDLKSSNIFKFYLMQSGLGLPDRDYYTKEDDRSKEIRQEYVKHVAKMLQLLGDDPNTAAANAKTIMNMETRLAQNSKTRVEMRNIPALYNKKSMEELQKLTPDFDWKRYFKNISDIDFGDVIVGMPKFFKEVGLLMKEVQVTDWKTYLRWHLINAAAPYLSSDFVNQDYRFFEEFLSGKKKIEPRWKRVVKTTNREIGMLVGQLYVKKYFPPESKKRMLELVSYVKKAMAIRIKNLEWMSDATKKQALAKLEKMQVKIGYPDKWEDYSKLEVKRDSYILNVLRTSRFEFYKNLSQFGKPVDPEKWRFPPQTVNAGYNPIKNEMTFPAGILQPPFFNPDADDAVNYGAIGAAIGHEMTHGFDDQGRKFDKDGNMKDWWTKEDAEEFNKRTQMLVEQYNNFVAIDDLHINGKLTLGENIADFAGLTVSYHAYKLSLQGKKIPGPIDGFTDDQRFFLSYAQLWRGKIRDKALRRKTLEDVHPWGKFRVNGTLFNIPEFYQAFDIKPGDKLYHSKEQRPVIW